MKIQFACFKFGAGVVPSGIRWFGHSLYSHVAILVINTDGTLNACYEAIAKGFVKAKALHENHDTGVFVDLFEYDDRFPVDTAAVINSLESMVGQKYDYAGIASFVTGGHIPESPCRVFCSEAAQIASTEGGVPLQNIPASSVMPAHVAMSPVIRWVQTVVLP